MSLQSIRQNTAYSVAALTFLRDFVSAHESHISLMNDRQRCCFPDPSFPVLHDHQFVQQGLCVSAALMMHKMVLSQRNATKKKNNKWPKLGPRAASLSFQSPQYSVKHFKPRMDMADPAGSF